MSFSDKYGWGRPEPVLLPPTPGRLLVATPELPDPAFSHTVVLLIAAQHGGWLGVVLNRPSDSRVDEVLPRWADHVSAPAVMFFGGPVELDSVVGLSSNNQTVDLAGDLPLEIASRIAFGQGGCEAYMRAAARTGLFGQPAGNLCRT